MKQGFVLIIYMLFSATALSQQNEINVIYHNDIKKSIDSIIKLTKKESGKTSFKDIISNSLSEKGYFNHLVKEEKVNNGAIRLHITLNKKYSYVRINTDHFKNNEMNKIISLSRKQNIIPINEIEDYLNNVKNNLKEEGYSFTEIKLEQFKFSSNDTINAILSGTIKNKRFIDKVIVKGYNKFPVQILNRHTRNNWIYNNKSISRLSKSIASMSFVKEIKEPEVLFKKDSTKIFLYLEKITTNTADGLIGFNNSNEGKLELNGFVNLKLQNNLNRAETFLLEYRNDNGDQTQFMTSIDIPYLWNSPIGINSNITIQRRDSTYQRTALKSGMFYKPNWQTTIGLNYTNTTSTTTGETENNEDLKKNGIELQTEIQQETTDRLLPRNLYVKAVMGVNKRELATNSENQLHLHATFWKLWHLNYRSKFLSHVNSYYLKSDDIQFNELYQFGGLGTIRGFNQNSIDSSFYTTLATEYRYRLNDQIYLHSILDIGIFENFNSKKLDKLYSFGGGVAILTQAGILNLSLANGRFDNAKVDLSSTVAHINLKINF